MGGAFLGHGSLVSEEGGGAHPGMVPEDCLCLPRAIGLHLENHPGHDEHELAADARSDVFEHLAGRFGFIRQEGSLALRLDDVGSFAQQPAASIEPVTTATAEQVAALHEATFPGTHSSGEMLLRDVDDEHLVLVASHDDHVLGYVAAESQNDGSFYIDYLGVAPEHRQRGIGRDLVAAALHLAPADRTHAHLTVREGNTGARALYASLDFTEERVLTPYRKGFLLD